MDVDRTLAHLHAAEVGRGDLVGLVVDVSGEVSLAYGVFDPVHDGAARLDESSRLSRSITSVIVSASGGSEAEPSALLAWVAALDDALRPRWVVWSQHTITALVASGVRLATCWDLSVAHRLIAGGWRADPGRVWAVANGLPTSDLPTTGPADLFNQSTGEGSDEPVLPTGFLHPEWVEGGWAADSTRRNRWAELAVLAAQRQRHLLSGIGGGQALATARSESAAELLCAELSSGGLPIDRSVAEELIAGAIGPRPRNHVEAGEFRVARDAEVLRHAPVGLRADLRNPAQVKSLLRAIGADMPDTRAWRLEAVRGSHPLIDALLIWRKAERILTTYGYGWLDEQVGADGRLRGSWTSCDGAAGRMTASGGLHNMPAFMRAAVVAEPGRAFVRADLGQIEPRVLAAVSGDQALIAATAMDDLYSPVATQLGVDRATAKVAFLGAMYGQTTGHGAHALRRMHQAYPVAMRYLDEADRSGQAGNDLRTFGGRLIRLGNDVAAAEGDSDAEAFDSSGTFERSAGSDRIREAAARADRSRAASRGRYARNALVQGAAAELFKVWAVTVRARGRDLGAEVVLCLHDELLVHAPEAAAAEVAALVDECLREAAFRWAPHSGVRFLAETSIITRWSDAK